MLFIISLFLPSYQTTKGGRLPSYPPPLPFRLSSPPLLLSISLTKQCVGLLHSLPLIYVMSIFIEGIPSKEVSKILFTLPHGLTPFHLK